MTNLADKSLLSGGDNKPPMLEKHLYDSWKSRMELYMMNRPHGRMILASVEKGPLVWPSITVDGVTRLKEYTELTPAEAIQADCDIKAINIILQGLPTEIYALVSQHRVAKDLWEKIKLLMQGTSLTKQERECKLYDEFDKFTYKKGESLHEYYLRFTLLLNDMNIYKMPLEQFQSFTSSNALIGQEGSRVTRGSSKETHKEWDNCTKSCPKEEQEVTSRIATLAIRNSVNSSKPTLSIRPTNVEVPKELPKVNMVNTSLKKLKHHLANFDVVVKAMEQHRIESKTFEVKMNQVLNEHERLLEQVMSKDIVNLIANSSVDNDSMNSTSASGSQPSGNTKKDKIQQTQSRILKNKVEAHPRKVKSSLKNKDHVVEPKGTAPVQHSKLNANSDLKCVKCNGCMLFDNHDLCVLDFINNVNARAKSRSRPTGRTFTIVGNACPLTRITTTTEVPLRKSSALDNKTPKPVVTLVYSRKPRKSTTSVPVNNYKVIKSVTANNSEPTINHLARHGLVRGLPKLKFEKDHLCSACALGKSTKKPHKPKSEDTNQEKLYLLHMDLCGPMRVTSVNGKKTDNGTEFVNQTLREYYEKVGISHETSVARSPQQNGVVERQNRTLIEAARTMLIYAKAPLFLWAKAVATACYTQNHSMIRRRHGKTPYKLLYNKPPDLSYLHMFGALCYPTNDSENLGKLQPKADIGIFIGYAPTKKAFRIYNRRTRRIIETIHVDFDELTAMASKHNSSGPALHEMTPATISSGLVVDHPAPEVVAPINEVIAPVLADSTGSPSSTTVDQDAPSPSNSQTTPETKPLVILNDVEEDNHDIEVAHMGNDPYFGVLIPEIPSDQSSSSDSIHTIMHPDHQISEHNSK
ncbi:putative ribonuclease H-like domain-containing protein [Tanacetum coccineum]